MGLKLHLPEPVAGGQIPLREVGIVVILRENVGNVQAVEQHLDGLFGAANTQILRLKLVGLFGVLPKTREWTDKRTEGGHHTPAFVQRVDKGNGNDGSE